MPADPNLIPSANDPAVRLQQRLAQLEARATALERRASGSNVVVTSGSIAGNGGSGAFSNTPLPGLSISYTPNVDTRARLEWQARLDATTGVWGFFYTGCTITPAALSLGHTDGVNGLLYTHNAGQALAQSVGFQTATLAANTAYTFQIVASSSTSHLWNSGTSQNFLTGYFSPL